MTNYERYTKSYQKTPMGRYIRHQANANRRGIPWKFTFETWWKMWEDSGKWELRGRKSGMFCMARNGDRGEYSPENVQIVQMGVNSTEAQKTRKTKKIKTDKRWSMTNDFDASQPLYSSFEGNWAKCETLERFGYPNGFAY